jgi:hypothetical protein
MLSLLKGGIVRGKVRGPESDGLVDAPGAGIAGAVTGGVVTGGATGVGAGCAGAFSANRPLKAITNPTRRQPQAAPVPAEMDRFIFKVV